MTLFVNVLLILEQLVSRHFTHGAIKHAIVFAKLNQIVSATLNLSTQLVDARLTAVVLLQKCSMFQLVNASAHQFNNADVVSFGMTLLVNASLIRTHIAYQIFTFGAIKSATVCAETNQTVSATLNL
jgi:hypothetical protein